MSQMSKGQDNHPVGDLGQSAPLGSKICRGGVNFSLFSREASGVDLLLFDREDDPRPARVIRIDPTVDRTYHYWQVFVPNVQPGQIYGYRVYGRRDPGNGLLFDDDKILLDPYGRGIVVPRNYSREHAKVGRIQRWP
jgi:isoamylase